MLSSSPSSPSSLPSSSLSSTTSSWLSNNQNVSGSSMKRKENTSINIEFKREMMKENEKKIENDSSKKDQNLSSAIASNNKTMNTASTSKYTTKRDPFGNIWTADVFRDYPDKPPARPNNTKSSTRSANHEKTSNYNRAIYRSCTFG